jgi:hypothetical protein
MRAGLYSISSGLFIITWAAGLIVMAFPHVADFSELERHAIFGPLAIFLTIGAWSVRDGVVILLGLKSKKLRKKKGRA